MNNRLGRTGHKLKKADEPTVMAKADTSMLARIKDLKGVGKRLSDINVALNYEGFYLPWNEKQIAVFFGNLKNEMTTADWNDENGNKVRLVFTPQIINEDVDETTLNVIAVEYYTIEQIVEQIRIQLHALKNEEE